MRPKHTNLEQYEALMDALPVKEACLFCEWEYLGTVLEGREEALAHRRAVHPERVKRRKHSRNLMSFRQRRLDKEEQAEIYAERDKRARLLGIEISEEVA